jgi:hypothetical protein
MGDLFGELCLAGFPHRVSTAVALTTSSIQVIKKESMLRMFHQKNKMSNSLHNVIVSEVMQPAPESQKPGQRVSPLEASKLVVDLWTCKRRLISRKFVVCALPAIKKCAMQFQTGPAGATSFSDNSSVRAKALHGAQNR